MNKHLIVIGIVILLLAVGLSGCTENADVSGDISKVDLVDYEVKTIWYTLGDENPERPGSFPVVENERDGFYHNYPNEQYTEPKYQISGTIKNIAGEMLDRIDITAKFYDINDNYLASKSATKYSLADSYTWDFTIMYHSGQYFENIDKVKFEFEAS